MNEIRWVATLSLSETSNDEIEAVGFVAGAQQILTNEGPLDRIAAIDAIRTEQPDVYANVFLSWCVSQAG